MGELPIFGPRLSEEKGCAASSHLDSESEGALDPEADL
jgi:hypothetical protein